VSFSDHTAQRAVAALLQRGLQRGRLAHAYLFAGPRGCGKEAMARTLAQAVNCPLAEADACGTCDSCRRIVENVHPDVYWLRPESKSRAIKIEQVRDFMHSVNLRSHMGGVKVGIVVDAECLNEAAANAFLKTLEEPPARTVILLLSAEPQRLLPTILSRCLRISFGPTSAVESPYRDAVVGLLAGFTARGATRITGAYRLLAELTALLATIRAQTRQRVETEMASELTAEWEPKAREKIAEQFEARVEGEYRAAREQVLEEIYAWFGDVLLHVEQAGPETLALPGVAAQTARVAASLTAEQAHANIEAVEGIRDALQRNISEALALEVGLLKLTQ
jgi:DNA polymerase-3 subunit delta'